MEPGQLLLSEDRAHICTAGREALLSGILK